VAHKKLSTPQKPIIELLFSAVFIIFSSIAAAADSRPAEPVDSITILESWIPMPDGIRLAVDLYVPRGGLVNKKYPVLLELDPYRKDESRMRNHPLYSYFVDRDYIVARVDIRGTGNSEGRLVPHEYSGQELDDGEVVIDWLSKQAWSSGKIGMFGISWSGFNAIQLALRNPPALKAIIPVHATEDLFQDDVHYMDGIMHMDSWEMSQDLYNALPGAPEYRIDEAYFENRFDTEPWMMTYKQQQRDGPFWDRASAKGKYDQIKIPSFHIGGWYDGYRDSLPRMLENVRAPIKAMIGPWSHAWPHDPYPKPGMEWRHEAVRWFDHWLKGIDSGIMKEPKLAVYVRNWHPPGPYLEHAPGAWRWEENWPIKRTVHRRYYPQANHTLANKVSNETVHQLRYTPSIGVEAGGPVMWWGDVAHDQRPTDAFSLVYDSDPLVEDTEILGLPLAVLKVTADAPHANWMVRLSDVAPDGTVTQITGAAFNGTHRNSSRQPQAIISGETFTLDIELHFTSWVFPKGHRIRMAVNNAQWPMLWPTPYLMTTGLNLGGKTGSYLQLPLIPYKKSAIPQFLAPAPSPPMPGYSSLNIGTSSGFGEVSSVDRNPQTGEVTVTATNQGATQYPWATESYREKIVHKTSDKHPENTMMTGNYAIDVTTDDRHLLWEANLSFSSDQTDFYFDYVRRLSVNGKILREKHWEKTIPRDYQ
jgi:putative CocE/NonD family hydrolase